MELNQYKRLEINGISIAYVGAWDASKALLFIGRSNTQKNSVPLESLLRELVLDGYVLIWPESRAQSIAALLAKRSQSALSCLDQMLGSRDTALKRTLRRIIKGLILLMYPSKWDYLLRWRPNNDTQEQIRFNRSVLRSICRHKQVSILSHSAGGLVASHLECEPNLQNIICFGYPFKHPERPEEIRRTRKLKEFNKQFLIIQGDEDEYGSRDALIRYPLSPAIEFEFVKASHEYENLSLADWSRLTKRIKAFLK